MGSFVALDSTNREVTVLDKNQVPSIDKKVKKREQDKATIIRDTTTGKWEEDTVWADDKSNYDIGDVVTFKTRVTVPKGAHNLKIHDVAEAGLTVVPGDNNANFAVYATKTNAHDDYLTAAAAGTNTYQIITNMTDGCDFEIAFNDSWLEELVYDSNGTATVEVEYKAEVNKNAVVHGDDETALPAGSATAIASLDDLNADPVVTPIGRDHVKVNGQCDGMNTNSTVLTFGNTSSTVWDMVAVDTFQFDLVKTEKPVSNVANLLATAKFELRGSDESGTKTGEALALVEDTTVAGVKTYSKPDSTQSAVTKVTEFESSATQKTSFRGLEAGVYWLTETVAPLGYNKLSGDIRVEVGTDGNITYTMPSAGNPGETAKTVPWKATIDTNANPATYTDNAQGQGGVQVVNQTGPELPSTGGIGTTVFYVVGGILVAGSAVLLITKRRMSTED
ncbi:MAG: isopeptide-forming domain-containing fimbrial protein [Atopobiaceae bacterium]|nr:isopeptide-forming domain-containing fimbrial protein [Atopobiaceae bacterium]